MQFHAHGFQSRYFAVFANKIFGGNGKLTLAAFFMAGGGAQFVRPVRPGQFLVFLLWRNRVQLELHHRNSAMTVRGAHAIRASVATANDDDFFAIGANLLRHSYAWVDAV